MKYTISIDQEKSVKWGLNLPEAAMFDFYYHVPSWADHMIINSEVYFFASKNKALEEMPLITDKVDTIYRLSKKLVEKGLIKWQKYEGKDWIRLTKKGLSWNKSEKNPSVGNISDELGKKSEKTRKKIRENSENFPTYNNTIDKNTIDKRERTPAPENEIPFKNQPDEQSNSGSIVYNLEAGKIAAQFFCKTYQELNPDWKNSPYALPYFQNLQKKGEWFLLQIPGNAGQLQRWIGQHLSGIDQWALREPKFYKTGTNSYSNTAAPMPAYVMPKPNYNPED